MLTNPFATILWPYFDLLSKDFEHLANEAVRNNANPEDLAKDFLSDKSRRKKFKRYKLPEIESRVLEYWQYNGKAIRSELAKLPGLRARVSSDLEAQPNSQRIFARLGVYYDSLIVPDPILRHIVRGRAKQKDYHILKYCIAQVLSRDVYLADVYPPIAVIFDETFSSKELSDFDALKKQSLFDSIATVNAIFAKNFDTLEEVEYFFEKVRTQQALAQEVANIEMFHFDEQAGDDPLRQIEALNEETQINLDEEELPEIWKHARNVWYKIQLQMMQVNIHIEASTQIDAHPVILESDFFHWLTTKVRVNAEILENAIGESILSQLPATNALLSQQLTWLSNVPLDALIRLRRQGFLSELRTTIAGNFSELSAATLGNLERISRQADYNLQVALNRHQEQIQILNQTLVRELTISTPTLLLSIGGAVQPLFGTILPSWIPLAATVGGAVSLKDIISNVAIHMTERRRLGKSPIGILWQARGAT